MIKFVPLVFTDSNHRKDLFSEKGSNKFESARRNSVEFAGSLIQRGRNRYWRGTAMWKEGTVAIFIPRAIFEWRFSLYKSYPSLCRSSLVGRHALLSYFWRAVSLARLHNTWKSHALATSSRHTPTVAHAQTNTTTRWECCFRGQLGTRSATQMRIRSLDSPRWFGQSAT